MATKAEIKAELDKLGIKYKARASLDTLEQLLADAVVEDVPEVVVEAVPEGFLNIEKGEIVAISFGEVFADGEYKGRFCEFTRDIGHGESVTERVFVAQSYLDVLSGLGACLKEEIRRWR